MKKYLLSIVCYLLTLPAFAAGSSRGYQQAANTYRQNQRNNYYMITQPDINTECNNRIYKCLSEYCGDVQTVPTSHNSRCDYATDSELYNFTLLCLQRDTTPLLPQYGVQGAKGVNGINTAARLCPSYVQAGMMSYLSMANMSEKLTLQHSTECLSKRQALAAAISCHQVALAYGSGTQNQLVNQLTLTCGDNSDGGSSAMVQKFANAGNLGASVLGWAEKLVSMDLSKKGADWQSAMDQVLAYYYNQMNLACGDNQQMATTSHSSTSNGTEFPTLTTIANVALNTYTTNNAQEIQRNAVLTTPAETIWVQVYSAAEIYNFDTARQVVNAGLTNSPITQNPFLSSSQMSSMQSAYQNNATKVFIIRDSARCFIVPVRQLSQQESSAIGQAFASCVAQ